VKQVVQNIRSGVTAVREVPEPSPQRHDVLIANAASLLSAGTERYVVTLARQNLLAKARQRPDDVKRVFQKIRQEGLRSTLTQVRARLDDPMPLGYSSAGIVLATGDAVSAFKPGDRVAAVAPHAGIVVAGEMLCARIPDDVTFEQAAYTSVAAIALEGVRLANPTLGASVLVIGLGLIGQIAACLLMANGVTVVGTDLDPGRLASAKALGIDAAAAGDVRARTRAISGGEGVDAVLIAAATASNGPIELAAEVCRPRGRVVLVGVTGLNLPRPPFFEKELEFTVSRSLGPGRGDRAYEEKGADYPIGYARWTAQRNMEAVLGVIAAGRLPVEKLTTHRFPIERAADAYDLIADGDRGGLGILLEYGADASGRARRIDVAGAPARAAGGGISLVGAGNFARLVLLPALGRQSGLTYRGICTAKGLNAIHTGEKSGFAFATTDVEEILRDPGTSSILIATRHDLHADLVIAGLRRGKHVFVEKPLCITGDELERLAACVEELGASCPILMVGFNRRFATATRELQRHFAGVEPLTVSYRFSAGELPPDSWPQDLEIGGGRLVGEACHAIDTCAAIVGSPPQRVFAESVAQAGGVGTTDDRVFITLRHANGAVSNVSYQAGGDRSGPGERIEVFGGGRTATVEGWDRIDLWKHNRRTRAHGGRDKGHAAELRAFVDACRTGGPWPIAWDHLYATTWASLAAVESLRTGLAVNIDRSGPGDDA
jgi:predicted dehydrogenase